MAGSIITLATASTMTGDFRKSFPNATKAVMYSDSVFTDILSQTGCVGIRIYNALDANGKLTNVLVGVDSSGNDLYQGKIYDLGGPWPPSISTNNPLNS